MTDQPDRVSPPHKDYLIGSSGEASHKSLRARVNGILRVAKEVRKRPETTGPRAPIPAPDETGHALEDWERRIIDEVRPFTMTSPARILATMDAVTYVVQRGIPGALVECGVWRGGSVLAMIRTLQKAGVDDRAIYLFDTFEGMTRPSERDTSTFDLPALQTWTASESAGRIPWEWAFDPDVFNFDDVRSLIRGSGYPVDQVHFVRGRVEDTLPGAAPEPIAVLRLDTDWYESTWHELVHLYPRVAKAGILIIDDYGHWDGCRKAVDQYFNEVETPVFLARSDYTGRIAMKLT